MSSVPWRLIAAELTVLRRNCGMFAWSLIVTIGSVRQALLTTALQRFDPIKAPALASISWAIAIGVVIAWSAIST